MCDKHDFFFEFDKAFTTQLILKFEASPAHPLTIDVAPPKKGVYALYRKGQIVYAGKALQTTLKRRLSEHARKITGRKNIGLNEMSCRYLILDSDWFVRAGEHALIESYSPEWNLSGFGSHVPGRGRPGIKASKWDSEFPPK
jgi:Eco29kI-like restriction endonuclease